MLHHHHGIADVAQVFQHPNQLLGVTRMQADTRFIQDVERAHQTAAQRGRQVDTLRLAARQTTGRPVQREVSEPHIHQESQALYQLGQNVLANHLIVAGGEGKVLEKVVQLANRHLHQFHDRFAVHQHVTGLFAQAATPTVGAHRAACIATGQHTILYLIFLSINIFKELLHTMDIAVGVTVPQQIILFGG